MATAPAYPEEPAANGGFFRRSFETYFGFVVIDERWPVVVSQ
jgi:hypothetical protein